MKDFDFDGAFFNLCTLCALGMMVLWLWQMELTQRAVLRCQADVVDSCVRTERSDCASVAATACGDR